MVSAEAIVRGNEKTLKMCEIDKKERPIILQIFGDNPATMAKAAKIIDNKFKPDGIDINMGCPVPKIAQKSKAGAALMKHPDLAEEIIRAIKMEKLNCPLSVKTRLGWDGKNEILQFALRLQKAGIDFITIHGRTKKQGYSGQADWQKIAEVKKVLKIPVIANGDVKSTSDAKQCLETTKADGIMIGRGALGNPWFLREAENQIKDKKTKEKKQDLKKVVLQHAELQVKKFGQRGMINLRKHLPWYFHGDRAGDIKDVKKIRSQLVRVSTLAELKEILGKMY